MRAAGSLGTGGLDAGPLAAAAALPALVLAACFGCRAMASSIAGAMMRAFFFSSFLGTIG